VGEPTPWNPKAFGEDGVTCAFHAADGVTVTEPDDPEKVPFQLLVTVAPAGRFTRTVQLLIVEVEVIFTLATKPLVQALIAGSNVAVQPPAGGVDVGGVEVGGVDVGGVEVGGVDVGGVDVVGVGVGVPVSRVRFFCCTYHCPDRHRPQLLPTKFEPAVVSPFRRHLR